MNVLFVSGVTDGSEILFRGSHGGRLAFATTLKEKKMNRDTVNDKFPTATFVSRYPTLNSVYASPSKM